jgi:hypothetical protein
MQGHRSKAPQSDDEKLTYFARCVIVEAILDLKRKAQRKGAVDWFNARETTPFGYGWCLKYARYNPNRIRRIISRIYSQI